MTLIATTFFPEGGAGYLRREVAAATIRSWLALEYDGPLNLHVADDGSPGGPLELRRTPLLPYDRLSQSRQERGGVGASLNRGLDVAFTDGGIALYLVDDWRLIQPFNLTPWVDVLLDDDPRNGAPVGMVRLGPPHPWLTGTIQTFPSGWGMRLDRHHFAFGHRPALYHHRMLDAYGPFREGVNAYDCERLYAEHWCASPGPDIVLALPEVWHHQPSVELADVEPTARA